VTDNANVVGAETMKEVGMQQYLTLKHGYYRLHGAAKEPNTRQQQLNLTECY